MATEDTALIQDVEAPQNTATREYGATLQNGDPRETTTVSPDDPEMKDPLEVRGSNLLKALQKINRGDHLSAQSLFVHKVLAMRAILVKKRLKYQAAFFKNRNRWFLLTALLLACTAATTIISSLSHADGTKYIYVTALGAFSTLLTGIIATLKYDSRKDSFQAAANNLDGYIVELNAFILKYWIRDNGDGQTQTEPPVTEDIQAEFDRLISKFKEVEIDIRTSTSILPSRHFKWPDNDYWF